MSPEEKILKYWILSIENYDQHMKTHFSDELKTLLEPEGAPVLHLFAAMLLNGAAQYWHISERDLSPGPKHPNQMIVENWIKELGAQRPEGE